MDDAQARLALADAMQLHDERVTAARRDVRQLRSQLVEAQARLTQVEAARARLVEAVRPAHAGA